MRMDGRRESGNVEDRRGQRASLGGTTGGGLNIVALLLQLFMSKKANASGGGNQKGGCGMSGIVVLLLVGVVLYFLMGSGGGCSDIIGNLPLQQGGGFLTESAEGGNYTGTDEEEALRLFSSQILASTEDVWTKLFRQQGLTYQAPKMVIYSGSVQSGCGNATSDTGPFYCSGDQTVYIDLSFFMNMKRTIGEGGDFAFAYVIAHEVGHHVQYLLGTLQEGHQQMNRLGRGSAEANKVSVRLELQADFYAGVWAHHEGKMFNSIEDGDIEEALHAASLIGDDYLQKKARGVEYPETFNHGRSAQRNKWLKKGINSGDMSLGNTFSIRYEDL